MSTEDRHERSRVYDHIAPLVLEFAAAYTGKQFHAEDLRRFVLKHAPAVAPNSPYRILYELKREGRLNYKVISRSQSLYQFTPIEPPLVKVYRSPAPSMFRPPTQPRDYRR